MFGSFVLWMQEKKAPVFVAARSNEVTRLPPEMLRKWAINRCRMAGDGEVQAEDRRIVA